MLAQKIAVSFQSSIIRLIISILLLFTLASPAFAQTPKEQYTPPLEASSSPSSLNLAPSSISPTSPAYTDLFVHNMFHTFSCLTIGSSVIGQPCVTYQLQKNTKGIIQSVPTLAQVNTSGGAVGTMTSLVGVLFANRPVRTVDYLATVGTELGIVKEAHAQVIGSGNAVLNPVIALWQVSRNISYLVMIIIFIVIGLMVMFRQKINPQTVITAQAAIPGLVIGLVLITFSYFLAGLIVDLSFVGMDLVGYYFQTAQQNTNQIQISQELGKESVLSLLPKFMGSIKRTDVLGGLDVLWDQIRNPNFDLSKAIDFSESGLDAEKIIRVMVGAASYQFGATVGPSLGQLIGAAGCTFLDISLLAPVTAFAPPAGAVGATAALGGLGLCAKVGEIFGTFIAPGALGALGFIYPTIPVSFVITFAIIFIMLYVIGKLFLRLLNAYLSVVFYTLTAPFHFLIAALPGRQAAATEWLKGLLGNVLAFPAVAAGIYFSAYLLGSAVSIPGISGELGIFGNTNSTLPLLGGIDLSFLRILLAFGVFVALPAIPDVIAKSIGVQGGGIMGLFTQEIQGSINAGRGQQTQFARGVGAVGTDIGSYYKKAYENPFEVRGLFPQLGRRVLGGATRGDFGAVIAGTIDRFRGRSPEGAVRERILRSSDPQRATAENTTRQNVPANLLDNQQT